MITAGQEIGRQGKRTAQPAQSKRARIGATRDDAVLTLLADPDWRDWSNVLIAHACGLGSDHLPRRLRQRHYPDTVEGPRRYFTRHGTPARMNLAGIQAAGADLARAFADASPEAKAIAADTHAVELAHWHFLTGVLREARALYRRTTGRAISRNLLWRSGGPDCVPGLELVARTMAGRYPDLLGHHGVAGDNDSTAAARRLFDLLADGDPPRPRRADALRDATELLRARRCAA